MITAYMFHYSSTYNGLGWFKSWSGIENNVFFYYIDIQSNNHFIGLILSPLYFLLDSLILMQITTPIKIFL